MEKQFLVEQFEISKKIRFHSKSITNFYVSFSSELIRFSEDINFGKACENCNKIENHFTVDSAGFYHLLPIGHLDKKSETILTEKMNLYLEGNDSIKGSLLIDSLHNYRDWLCYKLFTYRDTLNKHYFFSGGNDIALINYTCKAKNDYLNQLRIATEKCHYNDKMICFKIHRILTLSKCCESKNFEKTPIVQMIATITSFRAKIFQSENLAVHHIVKRLGIKQP